MRHHNIVPTSPKRVVVLGSSGFIAGEIIRRLGQDQIPVLGLGRPDFDLLNPDAGSDLTLRLNQTDSLVFVAAQAPCKDLRMLRENLLMAESVCHAIRERQIAHLLYISSDAVYKDSMSPLNEMSCAEPSSLHGVMHLAREIALRQAYPGPMAILRPTLVYGSADPHNGYGPNRFRRLAAEGKEIVLFGEGEERRDHVDVRDVAELAYRILSHRSDGILNAVSGQVASFRELAEYSAAAFSPKVQVTSSPRRGPMPHGGMRSFDNSAVQRAFPDFVFRQWREGLADVNAQLREEFDSRKT